ncbi:TrbG/VirB9 family P-type conjugative transfer protein [Altericroceibacterium endophyticum]|uniref:Type VI secretion protein n=1 Tax=Altericroceibacterium endophyticum TaxID=1808508 RepID=A0A6I4T8I5_9SPHN|nr:TrbG/VirB9 family P-type conjugative transfer protein [Altericroceibacterium endophyticum]MXO66809.1 type VI secretion protein [Altericroceibacterium endophyticum]
MIRGYAKIALLGAAMLAVPAQASDPRLVDHLFNPDEVVRIDGRINVQATIKFDENEHIENVAIGDSSAWQVTPNKRANLLFVKPLEQRAGTNMTVVTDKHTYFFDLVAGAKQTPLYVLSFSYPEEVNSAPEMAIQPVQQPNDVEMAAASDPYAVVDPAQLNFAWETSGDANLLPSRAYDDGEATFLTWAPGKALPAILVRDYEGTEGPVNFAVRGDVIVIDGVPREILLRSGEDVAMLKNTGPVRQPHSATNQQSALARAAENQ